MKKLILFFLIIIVCLASCSKDNDSDTTPTNNPPAITINSPCQFSCTIEGVNYSAMEGNAGYYCISNYSADSSSIPNKYFFYSIIASGNLSLPKLVISKACLYSESETRDTTSILNFYSAGNINYSLHGSEGMFVSINNIKNQELVSNRYNPNADQSGSNFIIDQSIISYDSIRQKPFIKVKASFNCKLYNWLDTVKTLTNGVAIFRVYPNL